MFENVANAELLPKMASPDPTGFITVSHFDKVWVVDEMWSEDAKTGKIMRYSAADRTPLGVLGDVKPS